MLRSPRAVLLLSAGCLFVLIGASGCEDAAAEVRAEIQKDIAKASLELQLATIEGTNPASDQADKTRQRLRDVISTVSSAKAGDDGQIVAAGLLASAAHRELAVMSVALAETIESQNRRDRAILHGQVDVVASLAGRVRSGEQITSDRFRAQLTDEQGQAESKSSRFRDLAEEVAEPIKERVDANASDQQQASRLQDQANALRRDASEQGHSAGLDTFEESIRLQRQADRFEYEVALRENDLAYDLQPKHEFAESGVSAMRSLLDEIEAARASLSEGDRIRGLNLQKTANLVHKFTDKLTTGLDEIKGRSEGDLASHYDEAESQLENAVRHAQAAAGKSRGKDANAARLAIVRAKEQQGRLHAMRARGLAAHAALLERFDSSGVGGASMRSGIETARTAESVARDEAVAALTGAKESLGQITGSREVTALGMVLDQGLSGLTGNPAPSSPGRAGGYGSAEELLAAIRAADDSWETAAVNALLDAMHADDDLYRRFIASQRSSIGPYKQLEDAVVSKFGQAGLDQMKQSASQMMGGESKFPNARIESQDATTATVAYDDPMMPGATFQMIKIGGAWKIDTKTLLPPGMESMVEQMIGVSTMVSGAYADIAARINAGEFTTVDALIPVFIKEITGAATGGAGGGGGGPPGGG